MNGQIASIGERQARSTFLEQALGRPERPEDVTWPLHRLHRERLLVTGAAGSIGSAVAAALACAGVRVTATDLDDFDVTARGRVEEMLLIHRPTVILHCAAKKCACYGEEDPQTVVQTNAVGTANLVQALPAGGRLVTVSTCKACNPETVYGASKLVAERITLNARGSVARLYNVVDSRDNVFAHWATLPNEAPLPVTPCRRYFMSLAEAVALILWVAVLPPGRYVSDPGIARWMAEVAETVYPGRRVFAIEPRRGDRRAEPRVAVDERTIPLRGALERVVSLHDRRSSEHVRSARATGRPAALAPAGALVEAR